MNSKKIYSRLQLLYFTYKDSPYYSVSLYSLILAGSILTFLYLILPQIRNYFSIREEIQTTRERIAIINNNIRFLSQLDENQLEEDFLLASSALPPERDVASLISAINQAAIMSEITLDDFSFQVGQISSRSTEVPEDSQKNALVTFTARGDVLQIRDFLTNLQQKIPLLALREIDAQFFATGSTQVVITYFYNTFPLITEDGTIPISALSPENEALLEKLRSWRALSLDFSLPTGTASSSLTPF